MCPLTTRNQDRFSPGPAPHPKPIIPVTLLGTPTVQLLVNKKYLMSHMAATQCV